MPIHPDQRHRYPADWRQISAEVRARAGHRCENCGVADREWGWREPDGSFEPIPPDELEQARAERGDRSLQEQLRRTRRVRVFQIVLTVAHLDHQPENNDPANLRCLCQRCHLGHDRAHHLRTRLRRLRAAMRTLELPLPLPGAPESGPATNVVMLPLAVARYERRFTCRGCGQHVTCLVHYGPPDLCLTCQSLGRSLGAAAHRAFLGPVDRPAPGPDHVA